MPLHTAMTQSPSHRRSPTFSKSKATRPVLHRRGTSATVTISKLGAGKDREVKPSDDDLDMASFLNFCAMCENQITTPNNSLLYCSESCRRKDSRKPLSASLPSMSTMSSLSTSPPTSPSLTQRSIVPPMTPTRVPSLGKPTQHHDAKSDLDPTEWKPVLPRSNSSLASSEAWHYLSQFHGGMRPTMHRSSSSLPVLVGGASQSQSHSCVPSLTNTPSVASSVSSTASDYLGSMKEARPLPPRHNPCFAGMSVSKGVELVVPHIAINDDVDPQTFSDSGSIFPASSAVWECEKRSVPIAMNRGLGGRPVETSAKN